MEVIPTLTRAASQNSVLVVVLLFTSHITKWKLKNIQKKNAVGRKSKGWAEKRLRMPHHEINLTGRK